MFHSLCNKKKKKRFFLILLLCHSRAGDRILLVDDSNNDWWKVRMENQQVPHIAPPWPCFYFESVPETVEKVSSCDVQALTDNLGRWRLLSPDREETHYGHLAYLGITQHI